MALSLERLRGDLRTAAPSLVGHVFDKLAPRLITSDATRREKKIINDPIWHVIALEPYQTSIIDLLLLQRLRNVRQLGLAHLVYPGGHHSRLEHCIGAMHTARLMLQSLTNNLNLKNDRLNYLHQCVETAALLHDAGHVVFSHAGEELLEVVGHTTFESIRAQLDKSFQDNIRWLASKEINRLFKDRSIKSRPSEILSTLLILSPALEHFFTTLNPSTSINATAILTIAGLVLGRPEQVIFENQYFHFLKCIVSGDLDADKLDYVARDSFYTGVSTFADLHRLLSQLTTIKVSPQDIEKWADGKFDDTPPKRYALFGIKPAAQSTIEMFIASRAYLYERIYYHHKVKAAEKQLLIGLREYFPAVTDSRAQDRQTAEIIDFLFQMGGDDAALVAIGLPRKQNRRNPQKQSPLAADVSARTLMRNLPHRALAIAQGFVSFAGDPDAWADFRQLMNNNEYRSAFAKKIAQIAKAKRPEYVIASVNPSHSLGTKLEVWREHPTQPDKVSDINPLINIEQHITAYQTNRQVDWIYSDATDRTVVSAAATAVLASDYNLICSAETWQRGKIDEKQFTSFLNDTITKETPELKQAVNRIFAQPEQRKLYVRSRGLLTSLPPTWALPRREQLAAELSSAINELLAPVSLALDFQAALWALRFVLLYLESRYDKIDCRKLSKTKEKTPEQCLSEDFTDYLNSNDDFSEQVNVHKEVKKGNGFVDYLIQPRVGPAVIIELKAGELKYDTIYKKAAGQPLQYVDDRSSRFTILLAAFKQTENILASDTIQLWQSMDDRSAQYVFCTGLQQRRDPASTRGSAARRSISTK